LLIERESLASELSLMLDPKRLAQERIRDLIVEAYAEWETAQQATA
jgi:hypothetical protein